MVVFIKCTSEKGSTQLNYSIMNRPLTRTFTIIIIIIIKFRTPNIISRLRQFQYSVLIRLWFVASKLCIK